MPFAATWKDLEIIILSNVTQKDTYDVTCVWNLKKKYRKLVRKQKSRLTDPTSSGHQWAGGWEPGSAGAETVGKGADPGPHESILWSF